MAEAYRIVARGLGLSPWRVAVGHVLPALAPTVIVAATLRVGGAILAESFLSFLGLGVQEPHTSLGALVDAGVNQMEGAAWMLLIPATLLAAILLLFNFLGDALRDQFDARSEP